MAAITVDDVTLPENVDKQRVIIIVFPQAVTTKHCSYKNPGCRLHAIGDVYLRRINELGGVVKGIQAGSLYQCETHGKPDHFLLFLSEDETCMNSEG